jgi:hypothetical protein
MQKSGDRRAPAASDAQEHEKIHEKAKKNERAKRAKKKARAFFELLCQGEEFRPRRNSPEKIKKSKLPKTKYAVVSARISQPRNTPQACFPARVEIQKTSKSAPQTKICFT